METFEISGMPSEKQKEFFAARTKYTAYGGARGGGKSWALRRKLIGLCLRYPGIRCLIVRISYAELTANHVRHFLGEYGKLISAKWIADSSGILLLRQRYTQVSRTGI